MSVAVYVITLFICFSYTTAAQLKRESGPDIQRCCDLNDYDCIRSCFSNNNHCAVRGDNAKVPRHVFYCRPVKYVSAHFNITIIDRNTRVTGLDQCNFSAYYHNTTSNNYVTGISCPSVTYTAGCQHIYLHRPLMEDKVYVFYNTVATFFDFTMTTIRYKASGWNLCTGHTSTYLPKQAQIDVNTKDPDSLALVASLTTPPGVFQEDLFLVKGPMLTREFINSAVCDFGCK